MPICLSTTIIYPLSLRFQKLFSQLPHHSIPFPIEEFSLCDTILVLPTFHHEYGSSLTNFRFAVFLDCYHKMYIVCLSGHYFLIF